MSWRWPGVACFQLLKAFLAAAMAASTSACTEIGRLRHHFAVGGVHDVQQAGAGGRDELAVDEVLQGLNHGVQPLSYCQ